jgi:hypothetical protein
MHTFIMQHKANLFVSVLRLINRRLLIQSHDEEFAAEQAKDVPKLEASHID